MNTESYPRLFFLPMHDHAQVPSPAPLGDVGIDLSWQPKLAADEKYDGNVAAIISHGMVSVLGTGLAVQIPEGYIGMVVPRSGLAYHEGITVVNSPGIIDPSYRGEIMIIATRVNPGHYIVRPGERIAQLLIVPFERMIPHQVDQLSQTVRGESGLGSTGKDPL